MMRTSPVCEDGAEGAEYKETPADRRGSWKTTTPALDSRGSLGCQCPPEALASFFVSFLAGFFFSVFFVA